MSPTPPPPLGRAGSGAHVAADDLSRRSGEFLLPQVLCGGVGSRRAVRSPRPPPRLLHRLGGIPPPAPCPDAPSDLLLGAVHHLRCTA